jgi:hypothetical protein
MSNLAMVAVEREISDELMINPGLVIDNGIRQNFWQANGFSFVNLCLPGYIE